MDQTDSDGNGVPDAIAFNLPEGVTASVIVNNRLIQIVIADFSLPFATLPDGALANISFTANAPADGQNHTTLVAFASDMRASLGTHSGQSAAVMTDDGSVLITVKNADTELHNAIYLPWISR